MKKGCFTTALVMAVSACQGSLLPAADLVLENVTVVDVLDGTLRPAQTIYIVGERITEISGSSRGGFSEEARIVDGTGLYVIPGLWDSHVHSAANTEWHFSAMVAHGITAVRNMHSTVDDALALTNAIKHDLAAGDLVGPRFLANGPILDGEPAVWPGTVTVLDEAEARAVVDSLADRGADFIKVYDSLSRETYLAILAQARVRGIAVDGHIPFAVPPVEAASAGHRTVEHLSGITMGCSASADAVRAQYAELRVRSPLPFPEGELEYFGLLRKASDARDPDACKETIHAYVEAGVVSVPTLISGWVQTHAAQVVADSSSMALLPSAVRQQWTFMAGPGPGEMFAEILRPVQVQSSENVSLLHDSGVPILAGTDVGNPFLVPGRSLHDELSLLVDAGLSPLEALQAATLTPAETFAMSDSLGVVAEGYLADLILLGGNPLEDINNVRSINGVVLNGRYFDRVALDALVREGLGEGGERGSEFGSE